MSRMCVVLSISIIVSLSVLTIQSEENVSNEGDIAFPDDLDISKFSKQSYVHQHHFHHHPDFFHYHHHHHHPMDSSSAEEEPLDTNEEPRNINYNESMQIPLDFIYNLNEHNVSDLLVHYVEGAEDEDIQVHDRFGDDDDSTGQPKSASIDMAKDAACMPELQTIKLASTDDPSILYIPQCTRVERCGGCCRHDLLSCQPLEKHTTAIKVYKTKYTGAKKLKFIGTEAIMVERHSKCTCDCRVQPKDCTQFQEYRKSECQCVCKNNDERKKCYKNNGTKLWNPQLCTCECRENIMCSTGSYFDRNECKCVTVPMKRRFAEYQKRSYRFEPSPVVPLNEDY